MNAKLPVTKRERLIKDMIPGEIWWTVPWGMWADLDGNLWINGEYTVHESPRGTVDTEVWLIRDGQYGVRHTGDHKWTPANSSWAAHSYPVVEFLTDDA